MLIIFGQRAHTREGRLQVELAQIEYDLPRLARQWSHLSRQKGSVARAKSSSRLTGACYVAKKTSSRKNWSMCAGTFRLTTAGRLLHS